MPGIGKKRRRRAAWRASAWLAAGTGMFLSIGSGVAVAEYAVGRVHPVYTMPGTVVDSWTSARAPDSVGEPATYQAATRPGLSTGLAPGLAPGLAYVESPPVFSVEPSRAGSTDESGQQP